MSEQDFEGFPIIDAVDHDILLHRDAHFGGQFSIMLEYYRKLGKGVVEDFSIARIEELAALELGLNQNIAPLYLSGSEIEQIAEARQAYKTLRSIYEVSSPKSKIPLLIADLILSEEEDPEKEIVAIVAQKDAVVPALIDILRSDEWLNPLFPGYGHAPTLAVKCLGMIGDKRAIISLFESLGQGDFFEDEQIIRALKLIGEPAKAFLLQVVGNKPYNEDNERAAMGLIAFKDDPAVFTHCFEMIKEPSVQKEPLLFSYLVLASEGIGKTELKSEFIEMAEKSNLSRNLLDEMRLMIKTWSSGQPKPY